MLAHGPAHAHGRRRRPGSWSPPAPLARVLSPSASHHATSPARTASVVAPRPPWAISSRRTTTQTAQQPHRCAEGRSPGPWSSRCNRYVGSADASGPWAPPRAGRDVMAVPQPASGDRPGCQGDHVDGGQRAPAERGRTGGAEASGRRLSTRHGRSDPVDPGLSSASRRLVGSPAVVRCRCDLEGDHGESRGRGPGRRSRWVALRQLLHQGTDQSPVLSRGSGTIAAQARAGARCRWP